MLLRKTSIANTHWEKDASGIEVLHAEEPHALIMAAGYLKFISAANENEGIFFRGQRKLYGSMVPTLHRGLLYQKAQEKRTSALKQAVAAFRKSGSIFGAFSDFAHEPLLQHYGISTTWVDLVDNIWVALWFACHEAKTAGRHSEYLHFERRGPKGTDEFAYVLLVAADIANRSRTKPGYFHGKNTELVDLRMAAPFVFLRPHAQHGVLFRKRAVPGAGRPLDYKDQIRGVIRVNLSKALDWLGNGKTVGAHAFFPPPYYDKGYQILLTVALDGNLGVGQISHIGA